MRQWDIMKAVLSRNLIALNAHIKNVEKAHISNLTTHLNALEKKKQIHPGGVVARKELVLQLKSIEKKQRKQYKESMEQRVGSL